MTLQELADQQGVTLLNTHNTEAGEGFVLAKRNQGYMQQWVTWNFGPNGFYWGHYFSEEQEARADFFNRVGEK